MDYSLAQFRTERNIPMSEMVAVVKESYPSFDKPLLSKCMNPALYGIQFITDARKAIFQRFDPNGEFKRKPGDRHKLPCSIRCRMDRETYRKLLTQIHADGFATVQDWLTDHVRAYINARRDDP